MVDRHEGFLSEQRWERLAPLTGVVAVALFIVGFVVFESGETPGENAAPQDVLRHFEDDGGRIIGGSLLVTLGVLFFLWFLASLRSWLYSAEGRVGRLSSLAFAAGVGMAILMLCGLAPSVSGAFALEDQGRLSPEAADALWNAGDGFFLLAWYMAALLALATALVILRTGVFPRWLGWVSVLMAFGLALPWIGWAVFLFVLPLWIILLSVWMWRGGETAEDAAARAEAPPAAP